MNTDFKAPSRRRRRTTAIQGARFDATGDRLTAAWAREREHQWSPRVPVGYDSTWAHVFRCECCLKLRREEDRRESESEICIQCVRAAGFTH